MMLNIPRLGSYATAELNAFLELQAALQRVRGSAAAAAVLCLPGVAPHRYPPVCKRMVLKSAKRLACFVWRAMQHTHTHTHTHTHVCN